MIGDICVVIMTTWIDLILIHLHAASSGGILMLDRILRAEIAGMCLMDSLELKVPLGRLQE